MDDAYSLQTRRDWKRARRAAFVQDVLATFRQRPVDLLSFEGVRERLQLRERRYLGLQDVPLDNIIGSVGRYQNFTRDFFPRQDELEGRWRKVDQLVNVGGGVPPIELYKVGNVYFVRDGNHRVSVARQNNAPFIQAYIWEYETRVPLKQDSDVNDLLTEAAYGAFLEHTQIDRLCPDINLELTQPDGYEDLLYEITALQQSLPATDEPEVPFDQAVKCWCDTHYDPIAKIIRQQEILQEFPNHTEADLYLWLRRNQEELQMRYDQEVLFEEAASDLARRFGEKPTPVRQVKKAVERLGELGGRLVESIPPSRDGVETDETGVALMASIRSAVITTPPYRFQGGNCDDWEIWRDGLRDRLWELLGVGERARRPLDEEELKAEVEERVQLDDLWRELIWLQTEESLRVPVYLFRPVEVKKPLPAIVVFPGHGTIEQTAGLQKSYQRANALTLARAGFITLTMELRGFSRLGSIGHLQIDASARLVGRTWYGLLVQDGMRVIDYLLTRPEVDPRSIGATGIGAGGALTMYTAALDERVRVAMINSYLGKYIVTCLDESHCPCNDIPSILSYAEMGDVAALIAPRPVMFVNGRRDPATSNAARESFAVVRQMYRFLGASHQTVLLEPEEMGHSYDNQLASNWFQRWLALENTERGSE